MFLISSTLIPSCNDPRKIQTGTRAAIFVSGTIHYAHMKVNNFQSQSLDRDQDSKMEDEPGTSEKSRKRKRTSEESSNTPIADHATKLKKKRKKNKDEEKKPKLNPRVQHVFRAEDGHSTDLFPVKISNIQELILFASTHESMPNWCHISHVGKIQKVVIVLISGVGAEEYVKNQECFSQCNTIFEQCVATKASGPDMAVQLPHETLLAVDIPKREIKRRKQTKQNCNAPKGREDYILSTDEMQMNDYPLPADDSYQADKSKDNGFISTKTYKESKNAADSPMYAIDCEMCDTAVGKELTRISVVDESFNVIYDTLVKPCRPIVDYKTEFSGITEKTLENVTTTLDDVQKRLIALLPHDAILLGHSLENDLRALKLHHGRVIDTSVLYGTGIGPFKSSLRSLTKTHLKKKIQTGSDGHCSIEDAKACMELVQMKIRNGPHFGKPAIDKEGLFERTARKGRIATMLDFPGVLRKFCTGATHAVSCTSDDEIVSHAVKLMASSDVLWAHLHEPEMFFKEDVSNDKEEQKGRWKGVLQSVDSRIMQIHEAVPSNSLFLAVLGCGDLSLVKSLQRQMQSHKAELRKAVKNTKKGVCFMKIIS